MGVGGLGGPDHAGGGKAGPLVPHTLCHDRFIRLEQQLAIAVLVVHGGSQRNHLEGGTRCVGSTEGTVEEGLVRISFDFCPVLVHGGQIITGIAGAGQNVAGFDIHDNGGSAFCIVTLLVALFCIDFRIGNLLHDPLQCIFGGNLQVQVDGGFHVVAGPGLHLANELTGFLVIFIGVVLADDGAVSGNHVNTGTVNTMEVVFKGFLKTGLANVGVHGVAFAFVFFPVGSIHATDISQNMGCIFGVVFPDSGGFHHQTGGVQLQNGAEVFVRNVLDKGIGRQISNTAQVKFIADADNGTGHFFVPFGRNAIAFPEGFNQQGGGDIRVQFPVLHKALEVAAPCGIVIIQRVDKGTGFGYGEVVQILNAQFLALGHQAVQIIVTAFGGLDNVVVENQVITGAVAYQYVAVPVQNIAPGGTDSGQGGIGCGVVCVAVGVDNLQEEQSSCIECQHKSEQQQKNHRTKPAYSFHVFPPI